MPNPYQYNISSISIFCKIPLWISISLFSRMSLSISIFLRLAISISIQISIFFKLPLSITISIFSKFPYRYFHRYRYVQIFLIDILSILLFSKKSVDISLIFQKMSIYQQSISIFHHKNMKKLYFLLKKIKMPLLISISI